MSTSEDDEGRGAVAEDDSQFDEAHLEAILKDPRSKASLLKKMGLGDETRKDQHPTPSGTTTGGWPPYPLTPLRWSGFSRLFLMGRLRHVRGLCPRGGKGVDRKASGRGYTTNQMMRRKRVPATLRSLVPVPNDLDSRKRRIQ